MAKFVPSRIYMSMQFYMLCCLLMIIKELRCIQNESSLTKGQLNYQQYHHEEGSFDYQDILQEQADSYAETQSNSMPMSGPASSLNWPDVLSHIGLIDYLKQKKTIHDVQKWKLSKYKDKPLSINTTFTDFRTASHGPRTNFTLLNNDVSSMLHMYRGKRENRPHGGQPSSYHHVIEEKSGTHLPIQLSKRTIMQIHSNTTDPNMPREQPSSLIYDSHDSKNLKRQKYNEDAYIYKLAHRNVRELLYDHVRRSQNYKDHPTDTHDLKLSNIKSMQLNDNSHSNDTHGHKSMNLKGMELKYNSNGTSAYKSMNMKSTQLVYTADYPTDTPDFKTININGMELHYYAHSNDTHDNTSRTIQSRQLNHPAHSNGTHVHKSMNIKSMVLNRPVDSNGTHDHKDSKVRQLKDTVHSRDDHGHTPVKIKLFELNSTNHSDDVPVDINLNGMQLSYHTVDSKDTQLTSTGGETIDSKARMLINKARNLETQSTWTQWSMWRHCSVSCGDGYRYRERFCFGHDNTDCEGVSVNMIACWQEDCPGDGLWSSWSKWTPCDVTCGTGSWTRLRLCTTNMNCIGEKFQNEVCKDDACSKAKHSIETDVCIVLVLIAVLLTVLIAVHLVHPLGICICKMKETIRKKCKQHKEAKRLRAAFVVSKTSLGPGTKQTCLTLNTGLQPSQSCPSLIKGTSSDGFTPCSNISEAANYSIISISPVSRDTSTFSDTSEPSNIPSSSVTNSSAQLSEPSTNSVEFSVPEDKSLHCSRVSIRLECPYDYGNK